MLLKTAHINGAVLSEEVMAKTLESAKAEAQNENSKTFTILDLFKHKNLCLKTCILSLTWIVTSALYYVLLLDQSELSDDHFSGFVATALIQIPGYIYVILTLERPQVWSQTQLFERKTLSSEMYCLYSFNIVSNSNHINSKSDILAEGNVCF